MTSAGGGRWLVTAGSHRAVQLWDPATGRCVAELPGSAADSVGTAVPAGGQWLATAGKHGVRIWDLLTKTCVATVACESEYVEVVADDDCAWLAVIDDGYLRVLSPRDGCVLVAELIDNNTNEACAMPCDHGRLATLNYGSSVRIWEPTAGMRQRSGLAEVSRAPAEIITVAPDRSWLVADDLEENAMSVWHLEPGRLICRLTGHTGHVTDAHVAHNGRWLATTAADHTVRIWDPVGGRCLHVLNERAAARRRKPDFRRSRIVGDPADQWIAVADRNVVRMWDTGSGASIRTFEGHDKPIESLSLALDAAWLTTAAGDGTVRIWESATGRCIRVINVDKQIRYAWIMPNRDVLMVSDADLSVYRTESEELSRIIAGSPFYVLSVAPDWSWVLTAGSGQTHVWDLRSGVYLAALLGHTEDVWMSDCTPDGSVLVTVARDHTARIWETSTWQCRHTLRHWEFVHSAVLSNDVRWLAASSGERRVSIVNTSTGSIDAEMYVDSPIVNLFWLPDGCDLCVIGLGGLYSYTLVTE